ncbi:Alpha-2-macroglobulin, partial [Salmonella enterica subsp. enterica serovar Senftenberg str. A4-543]
RAQPDTTCDNKADSSAYWAPSMKLPDGEIVNPAYQKTYYQSTNVAQYPLHPFPAGLFLLPAGLELENQNLADSSASLPESGSEVQNLLNQMQQADIQYMEFRDDRFVAAVVVNEGQPVTLVYLARAVTPGTYQLAQPQVESMYAPQWRATGASEGLLIVTP